MNNDAYVCIDISDIHFGAFNAVQLYTELEEFLKYIEELPILDVLFISGDLCDSKISLNSNHAKYLMKFTVRMLEICFNKHTKVRVVKGTESHDNKQLEIFESFRDIDKYDFKIYEKVNDEWLFEDLHVLYIPEEYVDNKDEYYKEYFEQEYDIIVGHGLVKEVSFLAIKQESENTHKKAPVFNTKQLLKICKGPILFGHIHTNQVIYDRFFYTGSFSRWSFGEEADKGFYLFTYSPINNEFLIEFVKNKLARQYDTVNVKEDSSLFNKDIQEQINYLVELSNTLLIDYLRIEIDIPEGYEKALLLTNAVNDTFKKFGNIKIKINNNTKLKQKKETEEKINLLLDKYSFIFEKDLSYEEKLCKFMKIKYNKDISIERMRYYLYEKISIRRKEAS